MASSPGFIVTWPCGFPTQGLAVDWLGQHPSRMGVSSMLLGLVPRAVGVVCGAGMGVVELLVAAKKETSCLSMLARAFASPHSNLLCYPSDGSGHYCAAIVLCPSKHGGAGRGDGKPGQGHRARKRVQSRGAESGTFCEVWAVLRSGPKRGLKGEPLTCANAGVPLAAVGEPHRQNYANLEFPATSRHPPLHSRRNHLAEGGPCRGRARTRCLNSCALLASVLAADSLYQAA